jgi:hypothetical protein
MSHYAIRNPRRLSWERTPEGLWLLEAAEDSNRISVAASGERWNEALDDLWVGRVRDPAETARAMYERGELLIEEYESALDRGMGLGRERGEVL